MNLIQTIQHRFSKTQAFKALAVKSANLPNSPVVPKTKLTKAMKEATAAKEELKKVQAQLMETQQKIPELVSVEVQKAAELQKKEAYRYRMPWNMNSNTNPDRKPYSDIPFSHMRRMAKLYPIARACINRRVRQITQLKWDVTTDDQIKDEKGFETQIELVRNFFRQPMGHKSRLREMLTIMVDDVLTLDAIAFEVGKLRGGEFNPAQGLIPVDPSTIALRVTEYGGTPNPPEIAYAQYISGEKVAEFTTDEMIYESMNTNSYSSYGLAPLESLILQCEAALRGTLYNLNYFRESNVPEGFITLPEDIASSKELVEQWQEWFDAMVAGDSRFMHRLKILPGGAEYTAAKKPEDMAFERFELWLLQQTCAVFEVQPQDIGITYQVNKATGDSQQAISDSKGLLPLGNFIKEILDSVIRETMGFEFLQWKWVDINPVNRKEEVELAQKEMDMGVLSGDEYRIEHGREAIGLEPYIATGKVLVKDFITGNTPGQQLRDPNADPFGNPGNKPNPKQQPKGKEDQKKKSMADEDDEGEIMQQSDLKKWRKAIYNDLSDGKVGSDLRLHFKSEWIDPSVVSAIARSLQDVTSKYQAKAIFDQYLNPETRKSLSLLKLSSQMREIENATFTK